MKNVKTTRSAGVRKQRREQSGGNKHVSLVPLITGSAGQDLGEKIVQSLPAAAAEALPPPPSPAPLVVSSENREEGDGEEAGARACGGEEEVITKLPYLQSSPCTPQMFPL